MITSSFLMFQTKIVCKSLGLKKKTCTKSISKNMQKIYYTRTYSPLNLYDGINKIKKEQHCFKQHSVYTEINIKINKEKMRKQKLE